MVQQRLVEHVIANPRRFPPRTEFRQQLGGAVDRVLEGLRSQNRVQQRLVGAQHRVLDGLRPEQVSTALGWVQHRVLDGAFPGAEHHDQDGFQPRLRSTATVRGWLDGGGPQDFRTGQSSKARRGGLSRFSCRTEFVIAWWSLPFPGKSASWS